MEPQEDIQAVQGSEFGDIAARLRRRAGIIVLAVVVVAGAALALSLAKAKTYTAQSVVLFNHSEELNQRLFGPLFAGQATAAQQASTDRQLASLPVVADYAAKLYGHGLTGQGVSNHIQIVQPDQSSTLGLQATGATPRDAAALANAFAQSLIVHQRGVERTQILAASAALRRQLGFAGTPSARRDINTKLMNLGLMASTATGGVELAQRALPPTAPSSPRPTRDALIGAFAGLLLGLLIALVADTLDRRLRDPDDVRRASELKILASVPDERVLHRERMPNPPPRTLEAMRLLHSRLRHAPQGGAATRSLLVTSAAPAAGKTTIAWYLAVAAAEAGERVVVVEADLRKPDLAEMMGVEGTAGLTELLSGGPASALDFVRSAQLPGSADNSRNGGSSPVNGSSIDLTRLLAMARTELRERELALVAGPATGNGSASVAGATGNGSASAHPSGEDSSGEAIAAARSRLAATVRELERQRRAATPFTEVDILFAGAPTHRASTLLASVRMADALRELSAAYDLVIVDTPPIVLVSDGIPLAKRTDGVLVVTRVCHDTANDVRALVREMHDVDVEPLGIVVNGVASKSVTYYAVRDDSPSAG